MNAVGDTARRRLVVDLAAVSPTWALPPGGAARIRAAAPPDWEVVVLESPTLSDGDGGRVASREALDAIATAEVYFGFGITRDLLLAAPRLRWVHSATAGVSSLLFPEMVASHVILTNSAGIMGDPIAEYVLAGVLYFLRGLDVALEQQRRAEWNKEPFVGASSRVRELSDCRALIVGTGGIGSAVARRFSALGARCTGVRRHAGRPLPEGFARVAPAEHLDAELSSADILVLATPLTRLTRNLLDASRLECLPQGAIVVNVSRGALLDEVALVQRLRSGWLRGAVLDVFQEEPLPVASPLWRMPNVLLTPHVSAVSPARFWSRELDLFLDNWARYCAGEPLRNQVDKEAGY
jgi:phosphoglycerate dehydrogenase-like enzyme